MTRFTLANNNNYKTHKSTTAEMLEKVMYQEKIIKKDLIVKYTPSKADSEIIMTPFGPMSTAK